MSLEAGRRLQARDMESIKALIGCPRLDRLEFTSRGHHPSYGKKIDMSLAETFCDQFFMQTRKANKPPVGTCRITDRECQISGRVVKVHSGDNQRRVALHVLS